MDKDVNDKSTLLNNDLNYTLKISCFVECSQIIMCALRRLELGVAERARTTSPPGGSEDTAHDFVALGQPWLVCSF